MKTKIFLLFLLISICVYGQQLQYIWQSPVPQGGNLWGIYIFDENNYIFTGNNVVKTTDAGSSWEVHDCLGQTVRPVFFIDENIGWALKDLTLSYQKSALYKSTDGGASWNLIGHFIDEHAVDVHFINENIGWACAREGLLKTIDGGKNWVRIPEINGDITTVNFLTEEFGWLRRSSGELWTTHDAGETWREFVLDAKYQYVMFSDPMHGWAYYYNHVYKSIDGGETWTDIFSLPSATYGRMNGLHFVNNTHGCFMTAIGLVYLTSDGGETWQQQKSGASYQLRNITFYNEQLGMAVGFGGMILKTIDGGKNWLTLNDGYLGNLSKVVFVNQSTGWAFGEDILHTSDGGDSWESQYHDDGMSFTSVRAFDENNLVAVERSGVFASRDGGNTWERKDSNITFKLSQFVNKINGWGVSDKTMYQTSDGGDNWHQQWEFENYVTGFQMLDEKNGFLYTSDGAPHHHLGYIWKTTNGGEFWKKLEIYLGEGFSAYFFDVNTGYVNAGRIDLMLKTEDSGKTWIEYPYSYRYLTSVKYHKKDFAWAGFNGSFGSTTDGGETWKFYTSPLNNRNFFFLDEKTIWQVGPGGAILKIFVNDLNIELGGNKLLQDLLDAKEEKKVILYPNYPNPTSGITTICFGLRAEGHVEISLLNVRGQKLGSFKSERLWKGYHEVELNMNNECYGYLPAGLYFYRLKYDGDSQFGKIVLLH